MGEVAQTGDSGRVICRTLDCRTKSIDPIARTVDVVMSTEAVDRYDERLKQDWNLLAYKANPVVLWAHDCGSLPLGRCENVRVEDGALQGTIRFASAAANPIAEQCFQLFNEGVLNAVSVGFLSRKQTMVKEGERAIRILEQNELIELSVTNTPANPEALARMKALAQGASAGATDITEEERAPAHGESIMTTMNIKSLAVVLALPETSTETEVLAEMHRSKTLQADLCNVTGKKSVGEALGVVQAWKAAADQLEAANTKIAALAKDGEDRDRKALLEGGVAAKKLTPAMVEWAKKQPLETVRSFLETAPAIPSLKDAPKEPQHTPTTLTHNGKSWAELKPLEKHDLYHANKDLYEAMRDAAEDDAA